MHYDKLGFLFLVSFFLTATTCERKRAEPAGARELQTYWTWDADRVHRIIGLMSQEPHPVGTRAQEIVGQVIAQEAEHAGLETRFDPFTATVPNPAALKLRPLQGPQDLTLDLKARNIYAKLRAPSAPCVILVGSHYDSKYLEGIPIPGANDSGSSSAVLLEIMRLFTQDNLRQRLQCRLMAVWFDAEESYLPEWRDGEQRHPAALQDHLYGSRYLAAQLVPCGRPQLCLPPSLGGEEIRAFILLDMVGLAPLQLTRETHSTPALLAKAMELDRQLFQGKLYGHSQSKAVEDDHIPFLMRGIPSLNLINFENLSTWHQSTDQIATISSASLREAGLLASHLIWDLAQ